LEKIRKSATWRIFIPLHIGPHAKQSFAWVIHRVKGGIGEAGEAVSFNYHPQNFSNFEGPDCVKGNRGTALR
jgi:hypothetical protein